MKMKSTQPNHADHVRDNIYRLPVNTAGETCDHSRKVRSLLTELLKAQAREKELTTELQITKAENQNLKAIIRSLRKRFKPLTVFVGGFAHDLRNVLMPLEWNMKLIQQEASDPEKMSTTLMKAFAALDRAKKLTKQISTSLKGEKAERNPLDMRMFIKACVSDLRPMVPSQAKITLHFDKNKYPEILANYDQLYQLIMNLVINASQAMQDIGEVVVDLDEVLIDENEIKKFPEFKKAGEYVQILVSDTGCGIDDKFIENIFDPWFSTKQGTGKNQGMGLAVVRNVVKSHKGAIRVSSTVGEGTTFRVLFKVAPNIG